MDQNLQLLLAKVEGTYGVDSVPAPSTDALLVSGLTIGTPAEVNEREAVSGSLSPFPPAKPTMGLVEVKFKMEVKGSGAAATPPEIGLFLRAARVLETVAAQVDYDPMSAAGPSLSIYAYLDGLVHKVLGCVTTDVEALFESGKIASWNVTCKGLYSVPTDAAIPSGAVFDSTIPPVVESLAFTIGGYALIASKLQLNLGLASGVRKSVQAAGGVLGAAVTGRKIMGSVDPEAVTRATADFWALMAAATPGALTATLGSAAGNRLIITAPAVIYDPFAWGEREGRRIFEIPLRFSRSAGDDEVRFRFN